MDSFGKRSESPLPAICSNVLPIDRLRLIAEPPTRVIFEYEDRPDHRTVYDFSLTCSGEAPSGRLYLGGYVSGKFRIFRADSIHRAVLL